MNHNPCIYNIQVVAKATHKNMRLRKDYCKSTLMAKAKAMVAKVEGEWGGNEKGGASICIYVRMYRYDDRT